MFWNRLQQGWLVRRLFRRFFGAAMKRSVLDWTILYKG